MPSAQDVYITPASSVIDIYSGSTKNLYLSGNTHGYIHGASDLKITADDDISLQGQSGGSIITFGTDSVERMRLTEGGDLGIGISVPTSKLTVAGTFNVSGGATVLDNAGNYALYFKNAGTQYGAIDTYGGSLSIEAAGEAILSGASGIVFKGDGIYLGPTGTSAGNTQELKFRELAANGTAAISLKAPDSISNENRWILPADIGTANQVLTVASVSSTSMTLDWADAAGGGTFGGSLSDNYIPIGTASDTIGNFVLGLTENNSIWIGSDPSSTTDTASSNTSFGITALDAITTGDYNNAHGRNSLTATTTGQRNDAFGFSSLFSNTGGSYNVAIGMETLYYYEAPSANTVVGYNAMVGADNAESSQPTGSTAIGAWANFRSTGNYNTAVGHEAMYGNSDAALRSHYNNVAVGRQAGYDMTTGYGNAMLGYQAGRNMESGYSNVAIGNQAAYTLSTGRKNVAVGNQAGYSTNGTGSVFIGEYAGGNSTANYNVLIGYQTGDALTTGGDTVAIGEQALGTVSTGVGNTAVGREAMRDIAAGSNYNTGIGMGVFGYGGGTQVGNVGAGWGAGYYPTGNYNVFMGFKAGYGDSTTKGAHENIAIGSEALFSVTSADNNVAIGYQAAYDTTTGYSNISIGHHAGKDVTTANRNIFIGEEAGSGFTTGAEFNVVIGSGSMSTNTQTGNHNVVILGGIAAKADLAETTIVGHLAGGGVSGSQCTFIGKSAGMSTNAGNDLTALGHGTLRYVTGSYNTAIGRGAMGDGAGDAGANVAIGVRSLQALTTGDRNVAVGNYGLSQLQTHNDNTTMGDEAGKQIYSSNNTIIGSRAGEKLDGDTNGSGGNTIIGAWAGRGDNGTFYGGYNTIMGAYAMNANALEAANKNVAIGYKALSGATTAARNIVIGNEAALVATTAADNVVIGDKALDSNNGNYNVVIGQSAAQGATTMDSSTIIGRQAAGGDVPTGDYNTAIGYQTLYQLGTGAESNTALGHRAGYNHTTGDDNTFIGANAGHGNTTAALNVAVGKDALKATQDSTNGGSNSILGGQAAIVTTGMRNAMVGFRAGYTATSANSNVYIGYEAGAKNTTGDYNVYIGQKSGPSSTSTESSKLYIHNDEGTPLIGGDFASDYVDINGNLNVHNIRPLTDNTYSLGTAALRWDNAFFDDGYIEINADGATTNHAGAGRFWVSGTTPYFNNSNILVGGGGDVVTAADGRWTDGNSTLAGLLMSDYGAVANAASNAGTVAYLYWNNTTSTLHPRNLTVGSAASFPADTTGVTASASDNSTKFATTAYVDAAGGGISWDGSTANGIATYKDADEATVESNFTFDGTTATISSATSMKPTLMIKNTNTDSGAGELQFYKSTTSEGDDDNIGSINFYADNDAAEKTQYARIRGMSKDMSDATEDGRFEFHAMQGGTLTGILEIGYDGNGNGINMFAGGVSGSGLSQINYPDMSNVYLAFGSDLSYSSGSNSWYPAGFSTDGNPDPNADGGSQKLSMRAQSDITITAGSGGKDAGNASADITFLTASGSVQYVPTERMRINGAGNIGIGTSAPNCVFHVNGDMRIEEEHKFYFSGDGNAGTATFIRGASSDLELHSGDDLYFNAADDIRIASDQVTFADDADNVHLTIMETGTSSALISGASSAGLYLATDSGTRIELTGNTPIITGRITTSAAQTQTPGAVNTITDAQGTHWMNAINDGSVTEYTTTLTLPDGAAGGERYTVCATAVGGMREPGPIAVTGTCKISGSFVGATSFNAAQAVGATEQRMMIEFIWCTDDAGAPAWWYIKREQ